MHSNAIIYLTWEESDFAERILERYGNTSVNVCILDDNEYGEE